MEKSDAIQALLSLAEEQSILPRRGKMLVAVSGGQDSVALLHALASRRQRARRLHVGHVDHRLRPSAADDAEFVRQIAGALGVPVSVRKLEVRRYALHHGLNLEAAARYVRYRVLAALAQSVEADVIVTAHTADDQVETVLLRLLRGTGPDALGALSARQRFDTVEFGPPPSGLEPGPAHFNVARPLLTLQRHETRAYCERFGLAWRNDPSNLDTSLARNRIRHHLLPLLETYNPSVREALLRLSGLAREDSLVLQRAAAAAWGRLATLAPGGLEFQRERWRRQPPALRRRLIRRAAQTLAPEVRLEYRHAQRCIEAERSGDPCVQLPGGLDWIVERQTVSMRLRRSLPRTQAEGDPLDAPGLLDG